MRAGSGGAGGGAGGNGAGGNGAGVGAGGGGGRRGVVYLQAGAWLDHGSRTEFLELNFLNLI